MAVARTEVNLHGAPPVRRVAQDDVGELEFPGHLPLPAERQTELVVFAGGGPGLQGLDFELVVFAAEIPDLLKQFTAREGGIGDRDRELLRGIGEAQQRQKQTAKRELQACGGARRQTEDQHHHQHHHAKREIIILFEHPATALSAGCR